MLRGMFVVADSCLHDLQWHRVVDAVANQSATDAGRVAAENLAFADDDAMDAELARVDELVEMVQVGAQLPLSGLCDTRASLDRARRGSVLGVDELRDVSTTAGAISRVRRHLADRGPMMTAVAEALPDVALLSSELASTFDELGQIRDDASEALAEARRRLVGLHRQAKDRLDRYITRPDIVELTQDGYYTQRDERYVIPVVASFQSQIGGIVHGSSNTGQTVYLEPAEFIEVNNAIKVAEANVVAETYKVLKLRTDWVAAEADELVAGQKTLVTLDVSQAKARLAALWNAHVPAFSNTGNTHLKQARNPHLLLKGSAVVANDILLLEDQAFLVITGPNTGGKTVTLSTVGTFVLMLRAGIPIPVDPDSIMPRVSGLFALIGDPQDISRDRSTFSGHLLDLKVVLSAVKPGSMVLLDEIIVGTEPSQGAALAIAALEALADRGARGFVTTHYERLKTLAFEDPRFGNANVGVDPETMAPTYVLTMGQPGSSNPFEVAARLGLDQDLIDRARSLAGGDVGVSRAIERLGAAQREAEARGREAAAQRDRVAAEAQALVAHRAHLQLQADAEVAKLNRQARDEAERALALLRERVRALQEVDDQRVIAQRRQEILEVVAQLPEPPTPVAPATPVRDAPSSGSKDLGDVDLSRLVVGDRVWVRSLGRAGEVLGIRDGTVEVALGGLRTVLSSRDLGRVAGARAPRQTPKARLVVAADTTASAPARQVAEDDPDTVTPFQTPDITLDLRGVRRDDVEGELRPFLDHAAQAGQLAIWVIHGHGTGVVKDEVRRLLRNSEWIDRWRPGIRGEGGDGVSIAWFAR